MAGEAHEKSEVVKEDEELKIDVLVIEWSTTVDYRALRKTSNIVKASSMNLIEYN